MRCVRHTDEEKLAGLSARKHDIVASLKKSFESELSERGVC